MRALGDAERFRRWVIAIILAALAALALTAILVQTTVALRSGSITLCVIWFEQLVPRSRCPGPTASANEYAAHEVIERPLTCPEIAES